MKTHAIVLISMFLIDIKMTFLLSLFIIIIILIQLSERDSLMMKFMKISCHIQLDIRSDFNNSFLWLHHMLLISHCWQFLQNCLIHWVYSDQKKCCVINAAVMSLSECSLSTELWICWTRQILRDSESDTHFHSQKRSSLFSLREHFEIEILILN